MKRRGKHRIRAEKKGGKEKGRENERREKGGRGRRREVGE